VRVTQVVLHSPWQCPQKNDIKNKMKGRKLHRERERANPEAKTAPAICAGLFCVKKGPRDLQWNFSRLKNVPAFCEDTF
jgi:hypothetical protein